MSMHRTTGFRVALLALVAASLPQVALAHPGGHAGGFAAGLVHPLTGADHVLAMLAVGMWSAQLGIASA